MSFLEIQFPTDISINSKGGPAWRTVVTQTQSGWEQRLQKWSNIKSNYDVGYGVRTLAQLQTLVGFFNEVRGRANGFRYKDWLDYTVTDESLNNTGAPTFQLTKVYGSGVNNYTRNIVKPTSGSTTLKRNGGSFTDFTIDTTTGIGTFTTTIATGSITNITQAANAQVTLGTHGRSVGDLIYFTSVGGMTEINTQVGTVASIVDSNNFTVDINTTSYTAYTSGGTASVYFEAGDTWLWSGEYDIPVRFSEDDLNVQLNTSAIGSTSVRLEEVRV